MVWSGNNVKVGPGTLYAAPLNSTEPTSCTGAWAAAWVPLGFCVDEDTEILTRRGWMRHEEVLPEDECLGIAAEDGLARWQPILKMNRFEPGPRPMIRMTGQAHDSLTTPNHRWLVDRRPPPSANPTGSKGGKKGLLFTTTDSFKWTDHVPCAAPVVNLPAEAKYTDAMVEAVAWFVTEGSQQGRSITIYQSERVNAEHCASIRAALTSLFGPARQSMFAGDPIRPDKAKVGRVMEPAWREGTHRECATFHLNAPAGDILTQVAPDKVLQPEFICSLTHSQLRLLLETAIKADGWHGRYLCQSSLERIEPFQMVATLAGRRTALRRRDMKGGDHWVLTVFDVGHESFTARRNTKRESVLHEGMIWCPSTPTKTWLARRNGMVFFTGNTEQGSTFNLSPKVAAVEVEEEYWPLRQAVTSYEGSLDFALAEQTRQNLALALNAGIGSSVVSASQGTNADGSVWQEPVAAGSEVRVMVGWDANPEGASTSQDPFGRLIVRQCLQTGSIKITRRKGANKATYACTFMLEKPGTAQPCRFIYPANLAA